VSVPKVIAGVVFNVAFYALLLFAPAGTLHWWRGWIFLAVTVAAMALAIFSVLPDNADLFSQRAKGIIQKGQPLWDRVLVILLVVSYVGQIIFISLDVFRFHLVSRLRRLHGKSPLPADSFCLVGTRPGQVEHRLAERNPNPRDPVALIWHWRRHDNRGVDCLFIAGWYGTRIDPAQAVRR